MEFLTWWIYLVNEVVDNIQGGYLGDLILFPSKTGIQKMLLIYSLNLSKILSESYAHFILYVLI